MNLSGDAKLLWDAAVALARVAEPVSPDTSLSRRPLPPMLFFTDPDRTPEPWRIAERLPAGAGVVYRTFGAPDAEAVARRLRAITSERGVLLLIGLEADLAERVGADGVHLPERVLTSAATLRATHPGWLLTAAVHSQAAVAAAPTVLDALILSPIFTAGGASASKPTLGVNTLADAVRASNRSIYALGGITTATVSGLTGTGACGFAAVAEIQRAFARSDASAT